MAFLGFAIMITGPIFEDFSPKFLKGSRVKQIVALVFHLSAVGMAERYVQLVLNGRLRSVIQNDATYIFEWKLLFTCYDSCNPNTKLVKTQDFPPANLLFWI